MVEVASDSTDLIACVSEYVDDATQVDAIRAAYDFAARCHDGQRRRSGDPLHRASRGRRHHFGRPLP